MKKIENLEEALEEAKTRRAIEEEEGRKKIHTAAEEGGSCEAGPEYGSKEGQEAQR